MSWWSEAKNYLANQSGYTGSDFDKTGQAIETAITGQGSGDTSVLSTSVFKPPPLIKKVSEGFDEFGRRISDNTPTIKNTVTSIQDLADATGYTGSDLDKLGQHTETMAKEVLGYKGGTTSPDPTGTVQSTINNLQPSGDDLVNTGINIITPPGTPGPGTGSTPQPTIAAGDTSTSVSSTAGGLDEQVVVGASRRPQAMAGRRKTMLTIGQTAAKLNAKRSAGY